MFQTQTPTPGIGGLRILLVQLYQVAVLLQNACPVIGLARLDIALPHGMVKTLAADLPLRPVKYDFNVIAPVEQINIEKFVAARCRV